MYKRRTREEVLAAFKPREVNGRLVATLTALEASRALDVTPTRAGALRRREGVASTMRERTRDEVFRAYRGCGARRSATRRPAGRSGSRR